MKSLNEFIAEAKTKFQDIHPKDHNGYIIISNELNWDQVTKAEKYNNRVAKAADIRIKAAVKKGKEPSKKDISIFYNLSK